jgi:FkbM family methyltransferase
VDASIHQLTGDQVRAINVSGISRQTVIGKLLRLPLRLIPHDLVLPILNGTLRGKKWISGSSNHGCWLGSYEYDKQRRFASSLSVGEVVFDLGANAGFYTLLASELVGSGGRVIAFEPLPENLSYLRKHLRMNQITNVQVFEAAVADFMGVARFKADFYSSMGTLSEAGELIVKTVSLDRLFEMGEIPAPSLIKMDIEGGEYSALLGARAILERYHPTIFLATHGREVHDDCCSYLRSVGYKLSAITGDSVEETDELLACFDSNG